MAGRDPISAGPGTYLLVCFECRRVGLYGRAVLVGRYGDVNQFALADALRAGCRSEVSWGSDRGAAVCKARFAHNLDFTRRHSERERRRIMERR